MGFTTPEKNRINKSLRNIESAICKSANSTPIDPLATEANQLLQIQELQNLVTQMKLQDELSETIWREVNNPTVYWVRRLILNEEDNTTTVEFTNKLTGAVGTPTGDIEPIKSDDWELVTRWVKEDVEGDGSGDINVFNERYALYADGTEVLIDRVDLKGFPFTLTTNVNATYGPNDNSVTPGRTRNRHFVAVGPTTFTFNSTTRSYTIDPIVITDSGIPLVNTASSTLTDSNSIVKPIRDGRGVHNDLLFGTSQVVDPTNIVVTVGAGDIIDIYWQELAV